MPTNKQRREAERRRLQRQLEERRRKQAARKRFTLIASIVGTLVVIAAVVIIVVVVAGGNGNKPAAASPKATPSTTASSPSPTPSSSPVPTPTTPCAAPDNKAIATFKGVTVAFATNLKHAPKVTSKSSAPAPALECADLVVGKGAPATPTSTVSVQYVGALYATGKEFDSSWARGGKPVSFSLSGVVPGFTQGIGGAGKVAPMRVGGRRIIILPAALGYGANAQNGIPANSSLVFVVDLTKVG
ncbi:MAG TPA: FKBP-type peptidyl-prolyl cis-trans isomerase [Jatrophihabitans sp.]|nr:FKBP-type peptidyl-prolyl cis-trans isomerase [Jatrophihabitans sp.]